MNEREWMGEKEQKRLQGRQKKEKQSIQIKNKKDIHIQAQSYKPIRLVLPVFYLACCDTSIFFWLT